MKRIFFLIGFLLWLSCFADFSNNSLYAMEGTSNKQDTPINDFIYVKGHGTLPDLHIAMMSDQELYVDVANLKKRTFDDFLNIRLDLEGDVSKILFRWSGVSHIDPAARGPNIDARALAILEQITEKPFIQVGAGGEVNPLFWAAADLQQAYHKLYSHYFSFMLGQGPAQEIFLGNVRYTKEGDGGLIGIRGLNADAIAKVSAAATVLDSEEDKYFLWGRVLRMIDNAVGITNLNKDDQSLLYYALTRSGLNWETTYDQIDYLHPRYMEGSSYAENTLGMSVKDCDFKRLFLEARRHSSSRQVVINNLATKLFSMCAAEENLALALLSKNGFAVQDITNQSNQREFFGDRAPYDRIYSASILTKKNKFLASFMLPYDGYFSQIFIRDGRVDWAAAYVQRAHKN